MLVVVGVGFPLATVVGEVAVLVDVGAVVLVPKDDGDVVDAVVDEGAGGVVEVTEFGWFGPPATPGESPAHALTDSATPRAPAATPAAIVERRAP